MSRENDGTPVPMSDPRRDAIIKAMREILDYASVFKGERFSLTCLRFDGDFTELVAHVELLGDAHANVVTQVYGARPPAKPADGAT